jgi:hypothetical protein
MNFDISAQINKINTQIEKLHAPAPLKKKITRKVTFNFQDTNNNWTI